MRVARRFDFIEIDPLTPPVRTEAGFLKVSGRMSRVGTQQYSDADGKVHTEFRPAEEVFSPESIESFKLMPVTDEHPPELVTAETAKKYAVGAIGQDVRRDGDWLVASFVIHQQSAIDSILAGRSQLSCGYTAEMADELGTYDGQAYTQVQRKIHGNHLAIVDEARAGSNARIRLDAGDARMVASSATTIPTQERKMPHAIRIDGLALEMNDSNAAAIQQAIDKALASTQKNGEELVKLERVRADGIEKEKSVLQKKLDNVRANIRARNARIDAMKSKMVGCDECGGSGKVANADGENEKCDWCDGAGEISQHKVAGAPGAPVDDDDGDEEMSLDTDELEAEQETEEEAKKASMDSQKRVDRRLKVARRKLDWLTERRAKNRASLLALAEKHLGADAKVDGLDEIAIKRKVLEKLTPKAKLDGKDAAAIRERFDAALEQSEPELTEIERARADTAGPSIMQAGRGSKSKIDTARDKNNKINADAWKRPAEATK